MNIDIDALKAEQEQLKKSLRELENEQRRIETEQKKLRQQQIRTKRALEALGTLIDIGSGSTKDEH